MARWSVVEGNTGEVSGNRGGGEGTLGVASRVPSTVLYFRMERGTSLAPWGRMLTFSTAVEVSLEGK